MKLSEACGNLDAYIRATDYLLLQLKNSTEPQYKEARDLITRVECKCFPEGYFICRNLYPFVGEVIINNKAFVDSEEMSFFMKEYSC